MIFNQYWFKPKKYGYGATPSTWEGWSLIFLYIAFISYISFIYILNIILYIFLFMISTLALVLISICKTRGEWCWRWGENK